MSLNCSEIENLTQKLEASPLKEELTRKFADLLNSQTENGSSFSKILNDEFKIADNTEIEITIKIPVKLQEKLAVLRMAYTTCFVCGIHVPGACPQKCPDDR